MSRYTRVVRSAPALLVSMILIMSVVAPVSAVRSSRISGPIDELDRLLQHYEFVTLDPGRTKRLVDATGRISITAGTETLEIVLARNDLRSPDYRAVVNHSDGTREELPVGDTTTYAGTVLEMPGSVARFSIDGKGVSGLILSDDERYFVEPLKDFVPDAVLSDHVFYRGADLKPEIEPGLCGTTDAQKLESGIQMVAEKGVPIGDAVETVRTVELATEADAEFVSALGSPAAANNEILAIMNQVEGVYQSEVNLSFQIVFQNSWTSAASDPYVSTNASTMIVELRNYWNANMGGVARDVTHMWTGKNMDGSTIGIAYVGVVCNSAFSSYGISQRYSPIPQKYILTAHELGHNFNACHSNTSCNPNPASCSNTIMGSSVGTGLTFCQFSRNQINSHTTANAACLSTQSKSVTVGAFNPATGTFFLKNSNAPGTADLTFNYGVPGATPLAGDWDGNGTDTVGIYQPASGTFFLRNSNSPGSANLAFSFGPPGAVPIVGDWNGDGVSTIGIYLPAAGTFFLKNSNGPGIADVAFGYGPAGAGWVPIVGDWDGDGDDTVGLYAPAAGTFFLRNSNTPGAANLTVVYGPAGAIPLGGDWTGLGFDSIGIRSSADATYFLRNSITPGPANITFVYGVGSLVPLMGDWDGQ